MTVRIVTDSAADIPDAIVTEHKIAVVPLTVRFGDRSYISGVELDSEAFWKELAASTEPPATAAPSAGDFQETYERLIAEGATGIVSIHLSSKLSATYQSAAVAAKEVSVPVEVVDTLAVSAGIGLIVLHAVQLADAGKDAAEIAAECNALTERVRLFGTIDTLEFLRRGGRIGGAQAMLGTMLKFKPVISVQDGVVEPAGRVRTRAKALEHLAGIVKEHQDRIEQLIVMDGNAPDIGRFLELLEPIRRVEPADVWPFGAIIGTHGGPGVIGVAFITTA